MNIDHIATLRQARNTCYPDLEQAIILCLAGGADGITAHLREDRRHIQDADMQLLCTQAQESDLHVNMEMAATPEMVRLCCAWQPAACCLVPEKRAELTTEGGLDVCGQLEELRHAVTNLTQAGVCVSIFIDADMHQIAAAAAIGAPVIELHTGHYADATNNESKRLFLKQIQKAAQYAASIGLIVHAGHGLTVVNTPEIAAIPEIIELNIGHSIVCDAVFIGLEKSVAAFRDVLDESPI
ncbi:MAG: pyridoxine 5'-phosphate synthase [Mariprofundales bacterium]